MRINQNIKLLGRKVILIPYEKTHVEKYHKWMQSPELQKLTASEPLSLEEEYDMQQSWRNDDDKCTFLILSKETFDQTKNEVEALIGDTNLFIHEEKITEDGKHLKVGEAEIMIAETSFRGQKLGWEAMLLMLSYGIKNLKIDKFIVKIGISNIKSIKMFEKMYFKEISRSCVFEEVTLEKVVDDDWIKWLDQEVSFDLQNYES